MTLGQLGRIAEARPSVDAALKIQPDIRVAFWQMARIWNLPEQQIVNIAIGLHKAGPDVVPPPDAPKISFQ